MSVRHRLTSRLLLLVAASSFLHTSQAAPPPSPTSLAPSQQIERAIAAADAGWSTRLSPVSQLPLAQKQRLTGVPQGTPPDPAPGQAISRYQPSGSGPLPGLFDWRSVAGHSYVTPVRNQGQCGSCWAFAAIAGLESRALISANAPDRNLDLSEQIVLSCSNAGSCDGGWPQTANQFLVRSGSADEGFFPYSASNAACSQAQKGWQDASYRLQNWQYVNQNNTPSIELLKNALYNSGPLVTTMRVYNDFFYYGAGVYRHVAGDYVGNHAILIVGWNDAEQSFTVKNSWDTSWGEKGFFRIAYSEVSGDAQFATQMTLADGAAIPPQRQPTPTAPSVLLSPLGQNNSLHPTFSWGAVPLATDYYLYVRDSTNRQVMQTRISATELGCQSATSICRLTPALTLQPGSNYSWLVLAGNSSGYSPWSEARTFSVAP